MKKLKHCRTENNWAIHLVKWNMNIQSNNFHSGYEGVTESRLGFPGSATGKLNKKCDVKKDFPDLE